MRGHDVKLSPPAEAALVVAITCGYFIIGSIAAALNPPASPPLSNDHLLNLLLIEPALAAFALIILKAQGSLGTYGLEPSWKGAGIGLGLGVGTYAVYFFTYLAARSVFPEALQPQGGLVAPDLMLAVIVAVSIVNPLFEEFFVSGYLITTLREWKGPWVAINFSVAVRLLYHLYQGAPGVVAIIPIGFIFAYWYNRTGQLWPVVVAHALFDFTGLFANTHAGT
jgi:uncharacterized protein